MAAKQRQLAVEQRGAGTVIPVSLFDQSRYSGSTYLVQISTGSLTCASQSKTAKLL